MAHRITIISRPHLNADGSTSVSKVDWFFRDRNRSGIYLSPPFGTQKGAEAGVPAYRERLILMHQKNHPNDKRGMKASSDGR